MYVEIQVLSLCAHIASIQSALLVHLRRCDDQKVLFPNTKGKNKKQKKKVGFLPSFQVGSFRVERGRQRGRFERESRELRERGRTEHGQKAFVEDQYKLPLSALLKAVCIEWRFGALFVCSSLGETEREVRESRES